jgi:hypothetical protein
MVEAYLGHRLNNHELVDLVRRSEDTPGSFDDSFSSYSARQTDWRGEATPKQVREALDSLGLTEKFEKLDEATVWSAEDRALYRRLSQPQYDPSTQTAPDPPTVLDAKLVEAAQSAFASWDRDGNIRLERQELDYLMSGGFYGEKLDIANDPEQAAVLATLVRYQDLLGSGKQDDGSGISQADLIAWAQPGSLSATGLMQAVNETYQEYRERASAPTSQSLASEKIDSDHLHQGVVGSCVLLSTVLGKKASDLADMLADNADGTYQVTFPDGVKETVREPSLAERLHHSRGAGGDRWPALIEIAAAQRLIGEGKRTDDGLRGVIEGIDPEFAIPALTGKSADKRSIDDLTPAQTRDLLELACATGGPVICGSRPNANGDFINAEELHNGIANGHCYAVKSFDRTTDTLVLQNPWHKGEWKHGQDPTDDGVFEMPLKDFYTSFRWVTFAKSESQAA